MSTLTRNAWHTAPASVARAASLRQVAQHWLAGCAEGLWSALENAGRRRAAPYLRQQADALQSTDPALAASLRAVAQPQPTTSGI